MSRNKVEKSAKKGSLAYVQKRVNSISRQVSKLMFSCLMEQFSFECCTARQMIPRPELIPKLDANDPEPQMIPDEDRK